MEPRREAAACEQVRRERLDGEREIHDLDRMPVAARDVRLAALDEDVGAAAAAEIALASTPGTHLLSRAEPVDRDLALVVAAVRDQDAVLQVHERLARDAVDRTCCGDQHVGVRERVLEPRHSMAVHVRFEGSDGVDLDDGDPPAGAAGCSREALPDPAVADDAELAAGEGEVREPVDRGQRRLPGAVAVVEEVLAEGVVRGDRREAELARRLHRPQPCDARRRLLGHAAQLCGDLWSMLDDPRSQLGAVVDDDLRTGVGDREQVCVELLARGAVRRVHLDPARDERGADRVLRRARVRAGGDHLCARVREQRCEVRGLRLQVDDDCDPLAGESSVGEPLARQPVQDGRVLRDPPDPLLAFGGERRIGDVGTGRGVHAANLSALDLAAGPGRAPHFELRRFDA